MSVCLKDLAMDLLADASSLKTRMKALLNKHPRLGAVQCYMRSDERGGEGEERSIFCLQETLAHNIEPHNMSLSVYIAKFKMSLRFGFEFSLASIVFAPAYIQYAKYVRPYSPNPSYPTR